ncbi:MAG: FAD-dependent oxidoreductase [Proteobacteria bacterium]|nr:FAD-dependent oxidoreductase [Pseudomonadota bacterium]
MGPPRSAGGSVHDSLRRGRAPARSRAVSRGRAALLAALVIGVLAILALDPGAYLNLATLKAQQARLATWVSADRGTAMAWGFATYVLVTALSIPGAAVMTLAAGALFGFTWGTLLVSFASTLGATCAFLVARHVLRGAVQARFGHRLEAINRRIRSDGPSYLLSLRLVPLFPFVVVNVVMALTPIRVRDFMHYSQLGMLPATMVYVNAGTQLARVESLGDVLTTPVLVSLLLLGLFPLLATHLRDALKRRRFLADHPPPAQVDRNVIVIGAGSAGLVAALIGASLRAKVTLVEQQRMGGDCLNTGCVPSKALLKVARQVHQARHAARLGIRHMSVEFDFADIMARVREVIAEIAPHDSVARFESLGVECIQGNARLLSPYRVAVGEREMSARAIILATGAEPHVPPIPGLDAIAYLTSDTLWDLRRLPPRLLVLGGGPIGCELAQAFARLGSEVTVVDMAAQLLPREDDEVGALLAEVFRDEGIRVELNARATRFVSDDDGRTLMCERTDGDQRHGFSVAFDEVIIALGRRPRVQGFGLEELGVPLTDNGALAVNDYLETHLPSVFACGDVAGPYQFTHAASHQAWYATVNALFGNLKRFAVDYRVMPWCTFVDPEVARVGLNEREARARGIAFEVTRYPLAELDRAIADGATQGFVKVLTPPGSDRILGVTIVGEHAGEMIAEFVLAMKHGLGLGKILGTIHVYPTLAEANKMAAGAWRRAHAWPRVMGWLARYHAWRREG